MTAIRLLQDSSRWTTSMVVVLAVSLGWIALSRVPPAATTGGAPPPSAREGFSAPDFTLDLLSGGQITLSELRDKVVVVNLWASWCSPCRAEMPAIERVYQANKGRGLEVLAVNTAYQDSEHAARAFVQEHDLSFHVPLDQTGTVANRYLLRALPTTFFLDRRGVIQYVAVGGPMNETLIQSKVEDLLAE